MSNLSPFATAAQPVSNTVNPLFDTSSNNNNANTASQDTASPNIPAIPTSINQPNTQANQEVNKTELSPIDKYKDIFDTTPEVKKDESGNVITPEPPKFDITSNLPKTEQFQQAYDKVNLLDANDAATVELTEKALSGDAQSLVMLLNNTAKKILATSVQHSLKGAMGHITENIGTLQQQTVNKATDSFRNATLLGGLKAKFPNLEKVPVSQVSSIVDKFVAKSGNKTDNELLSDLSEYLPAVFNLGETEQQKQVQEEEELIDWSQI